MPTAITVGLDARGPGLFIPARHSPLARPHSASAVLATPVDGAGGEAYPWDMRPIPLALILAAGIVGCGLRQRACYELVGMNREARTAVVFNACTGDVEYRNLPPMSTETPGRLS